MTARDSTPITISLLKKANLGAFSRTSLFAASTKYICLEGTEKKAKNASICVIDVDNSSKIVRSPILDKAYEYIVNPSLPILVVREQEDVHLFNIEQMKVLKSCKFTGGKMKWLSAYTLSMVNSESLYHWSLDGNSGPTKLLERLPSDRYLCVKDYTMDSTHKWMCFVTDNTSSAEKEHALIYSVEKKVSHWIEGEVASFFDYKSSGDKLATFIVTATRIHQGVKISVFDVANKTTKCKKETRLGSTMEPECIFVSTKHEIIYVTFSSSGPDHCIGVFDRNTLQLVGRCSVPYSFSSFQETPEGVACIDDKGQVLLVQLDEEHIATTFTKSSPLPRPSFAPAQETYSSMPSSASPSSSTPTKQRSSSIPGSLNSPSSTFTSSPPTSPLSPTSSSSSTSTLRQSNENTQQDTPKKQESSLKHSSSSPSSSSSPPLSSSFTLSPTASILFSSSTATTSSSPSSSSSTTTTSSTPLRKDVSRDFIFVEDYKPDELIAKLIHTAKNLVETNDLRLARAYSMVVLNEEKTLDLNVAAELVKIISAADHQEEALHKQEARMMVERLQQEFMFEQARLFKARGEQTKELQEKQKILEVEKSELDKRMAELSAKEIVQERRAKYLNKWSAAAEASKRNLTSKESTDLMVQVREANDKVAKDKDDLAEKLARAEEIRERLAQSETELKQKVEKLQNYLDSVEKKGLLPETACFKRFLKAVRECRQQKLKCFVSYAWLPDKMQNESLQAKLLRLKGDLTDLGIEVLLDISNMEGDIDEYMVNGITTSNKVLLICTPRLRERAEAEGVNNLKKEIAAALEIQREDPKFIIPIIFEGDRFSSVPRQLPNILSLDFSDPEDYSDTMTSINPKGLIPMLLGIEEGTMWYTELVKGYQAQLRELAPLSPHSNHKRSFS